MLRKLKKKTMFLLFLLTLKNICREISSESKIKSENCSKIKIFLAEFYSQPFRRENWYSITVLVFCFYSIRGSWRHQPWKTLSFTWWYLFLSFGSTAQQNSPFFCIKNYTYFFWILIYSIRLNIKSGTFSAYFSSSTTIVQSQTE